MNNIETVLIDMPEILLRMKIGNDYTLPELKKVFNKVCNAVTNRKKYAKRNRLKVVHPDTSLAAQQLFPDIFVRPKDEYMYMMLQQIA